MKFQRRTVWCILFAAMSAAMFGQVPGHATQTEVWTTTTFEQFQQGKFDHVALATHGTLTLAPTVESVLSLSGSDIHVWALVEDSQGNIYAGTGEGGKIFKITPDGDATLFFDSPEIEILSVAVDADDNLYAGSAPDGLIYKITPDGNPATFFTTAEPYVWSLAFGPDNVLYAGTGDSGKVFAIQPDGTGRVLYDSSQTHVMTVLYDPQGWIYAGTEGKGILYKLDMEGNAFGVYHAGEEEIHALALDSQGNLYAAALSNRVYPKAQSPSGNEAQPAPQEQQGTKMSVIYQVTPQGRISQLLELENTLVYALLIDAEEQILLGTDNEGMIYQVMPDGEYHQILKADAGAVLGLLQHTSGSVYLSTGDMGGVARMSSEPEAAGEYLSPVHDASTVATWGQIFWRGSIQSVTLSTRTGNTAIPDETWSQWSEALLHQEGEAIPNPAARYIQWKAMFTPQDQQIPRLEEVSAAYLPQNLAPKITSVSTFHPADLKINGNGNGGGTSTPAASGTPVAADTRKSSSPPKTPTHVPAGQMAVMWEAKDPNNEPLVYTVSLRGENESRWKVLEEDLEETQYVLDTSTLPDGEYYIKVTAGDSLSNPASQAYTVEKESERFQVDTTAPTVSIALNQQQEDDGTVVLTVVAQDEASRLQQAEYALDTGDWMTIFPDDLVTDSHDEKYSVALSELSPEQHVLTFKATDRLGNTGIGKLQFTAGEVALPSVSPAPTAIEEEGAPPGVN